MTIPMGVHALETAPREIFQVALEDAEAAVAEALVHDGAAERIKTWLIAPRSRILYQYPRPVTLKIRTLRHDPQSRRWNASLLFVSDGQVLTAVPIAGRYDALVEVPVLKQRLLFGDVIEKDDIGLEDITVSRLRKDFFQDAAAMIGLTPKRAVSPGRPVYSHELVAPRILKKGQAVTMRFSAPHLEIQTTGESMDDGALGETVRVKNSDSKKIVHAVVESADAVRIAPPPGEWEGAGL